MNELDEMWQRLSEHQAFADARGYGEAWRKMCKQRTADAACDAATAAAWAFKPENIEAEIWAASKAASAAQNALDEADEAIKRINRAEGYI